MTPEKPARDNAGEGPKFRQIYRSLRDALDDGTYEPGGKLPSEQELAGSFGASRPTIRRALAQLESEGYIEKRMGAGTRVAERNQHRNHVFGLLIPDLGSTEIFEPICQGIAQGQHELLWGPMLVSDGSKESKEAQAEHLCRYYIERKVSGVFFAPIELTPSGDAVNLGIIRALEEAKIPIILLDRDICHYPERSRFDLVGIDNRRAGYLITEHLLLSGSKRVAFFARPFSAHTVHARIDGYRAAIYAHLGREAHDLAQWIDPRDETSVRAFLNRHKPDAIVCANDFTAAQLFTTLNNLGIEVPGKLKVAGMDDVKYAQLLQAPLTTIHQPCFEIGATALRAMLDRIARPNAPSRDYLLDFRLVMRKSTAPNEHLAPRPRLKMTPH